MVELTLALHRTFDSPTRPPAVGHRPPGLRPQARHRPAREAFTHLRQEDGLSGYPSRTESEHDWVENSHASTILSYAHGMATAFELQGKDRRVVAVVGDGALTGGMAYEALNNLGHSGKRVVIVLNDNGRSYAPTVSQLSLSLTHLRLSPAYVQARQRLRHLLRELPAVGELAYSGVHGLTSALREVVTPHTFFEALGIRYVGPIDGHDIAGLEQALANAAEWDGPIVVHVLTQKGRGYAPAEEDDVQRLHDVKVKAPEPAPLDGPDAPADAAVPMLQNASLSVGGSDDRPRHAGDHLHRRLHPGPPAARRGRPPHRGHHRRHARTHRPPPVRGPLPRPVRRRGHRRAARRDVGGRAWPWPACDPVVAVYSTFFSRAFDQANLDVGLHRLPVVLVLDRAGITGDDGPSHHGVLDMALGLVHPGHDRLRPLVGPRGRGHAGHRPHARRARRSSASRRRRRRRWPPGPWARACRPAGSATGDGSVCILAVGKMLGAAVDGGRRLAAEGIDVTVWDARVVSHPDPAMLADAARHARRDHRRGRRPPGWGRDVPGRRPPGARCRSAPARRGAPRDPTAFLAQGKPDRILARLGLDGTGIVRTVRETLAELQHPAELRSPVTPGSDAPG